jgi:predicted O-methyltransferase YrrM
MITFQPILRTIRRYPKFYASLILPYYFLRFVIASIRERSYWFYRYPPGHYSSTIPSQREIGNKETELFDLSAASVPGIALNENYQLRLLRDFSRFDKTYAFNPKPTVGARYYYENAPFRLSDAVVLYCFLSHFRPQRVLEIGSGFSSALMLDLQESLFHDLQLTFVEPYPRTLKRLMRQPDWDRCQVIEQAVQEVSLELFCGLEANDVLFIDSSHVLKIGSDLSRIFFSILPALRSGVLIHFHDIFWPFEYPKIVIAEGRNWNELYLVRSFLQHNDAFEILFFSSYLEIVHRSELEKNLKDYSEHTGNSLWLRKK